MKSVTLTPRDNGYGRYIFGLQGSSNYRVSTTPLETLKYSAYEVVYWIDATFQGLRMLGVRASWGWTTCPGRWVW